MVNNLVCGPERVLLPDGLWLDGRYNMHSLEPFSIMSVVLAVVGLALEKRQYSVVGYFTHNVTNVMCDTLIIC